ncbi:glycosyltransferase involved in cell wall biosynthesis [Rhodococcus sp. LBL1]|nr:glycosyltransferase involved in cell wall biosynthesis [Rhodococcus sp. LBL1]MDH6681139.1 glycosyltransferase involved in cell wall biosynthesis [Rhodococcus sp. LBL2]
MSDAMRPTPALISVVIAALDIKGIIDVQLTALAQQDYDGAFEVVVADNGSTDGLEEYLRHHPLRDRLRLSWADASDARGVSHARNVGVARSSGEFLAFCDADDRVHPDWLRHLAAAAMRFDAVAGALDGRPLSSERAVAWRPLSDVATQPTSANARFPWGGGGNMGIWREVFDEIGGWDTSYVYALEDMEFSWRLQLRGHSLGWEPRAVVDYRLRDDLRSLYRQSFAYGRGEVQLYRDHRSTCMSGRPVPYLVLLIVLIVIRNPLLPTTLTRLPRGQWLWHVSALRGRVAGSREFDVFYV